MDIPNNRWYHLTMNLDSNNQPVLIGLCGKAGTGKTSVANLIVPQHALKYDTENSTVWDHTTFAMPLYEMASIKRMTKGIDSENRILYQLHEVLFDLFGKSPLYGAPSYDEFVLLVKQIAGLPMPFDDDIKPREFLQKAGEICRDNKEDCFVHWVRRKAIQKASTLTSENDEDHHYRHYVCIVSDVRYENEAEMIASQPNGILIRFDASNETRMQRLLNRDGYTMPESQLNHKSEQVENISEDLLNAVINTDNMSIAEQAQETIQIIQKELSRVYA
jgi:gluconate kinase